jgi:gliding motility-associated-like protein
MKKIASIFFLSFAFVSVNAQLLINEYSASNISIASSADFQGDYNDFIEIFNTTGTPVNLNGYYFSDNAANPTKWQFTANVNVPANGVRVIHCSGKDTILASGQAHTKFKLTQCHANQIIIANPGGMILDSLTMIRTKKNHSRGRTTNGAATFSVFSTPTFNTANGTAYTAYDLRPIMSLAPGHYASAQTLTLTAPSGNSTIRYTTNGLTPTATSTLYTTPIAIDSTMVIRAICFSADASILPSFVETNTFFINENHAFAIISLCGTYTGGSGLFGNSQPIDNSFEYFDINHNFKWEFEGESKRHGHDSWAFAQKGIGIEVLDEYGYMAEMPQKFFGNTPRDSFKKIILKAGASDNYPGSTWNPNRTYAHMRDAYTQTYSIKNNLNLDERSYDPAVVYINGRYWGIYEVRERVDNDYTDYYYGQTKNKIDVIQHWGGTNAIYGSDTGWNNLDNYITTNSMAVPANYNYVSTQLDFQSLIDYFVINTWCVNTDWLNWNTMWWRGRKGAGVKWRYCLWDMDNVFNLGENYTGLSSTEPDNAPCEAITLFQNDPDIEHTRMLTRLLQNPDFENLYKTRYAYLTENVFRCDSMIAHLDRFEQSLQVEMPQHVARWGGTVAKWHEHVDSIRQFILRRCTVIGGDNDTCFNIKKLKFNVDPPLSGNILMDGTPVSLFYPVEKTLAGDSIYNLKATPIPGYEFVEWRKYTAANTLSPSLTDSIITYDLIKADSIVAVFKIDLPDTLALVIDAVPSWAGTVTFDATVISIFPTTLQVVENTTHTITATPNNTHVFTTWSHYNTFNNSITPNLTSKTATFAFKKMDTIVAHFDTLEVLGSNVFVPNAFSPNGDGKNDIFGLFTVNNNYLTVAKLKIFDRWGTEMYSGDGLNTGWDGKYNKVPVAGAVYYYILNITHKDGSTNIFKGDLVLVR